MNFVCTNFFSGNIYGNVTQETVNEIVLKAVQSGINFIDTSPWYGQGVSEERLGIALKNIPREKYYIATKVCSVHESGNSCYGVSILYFILCLKISQYTFDLQEIFRLFNC